jgi:hypothetical protein
MKTRLYWATQHIKRGIHDLRVAAICWWLSQQVDFLRWRCRLDALIPYAQPIPEPYRRPKEAVMPDADDICGDETLLPERRESCAVPVAIT